MAAKRRKLKSAICPAVAVELRHELGAYVSIASARTTISPHDLIRIFGDVDTGSSSSASEERPTNSARYTERPQSHLYRASYPQGLLPEQLHDAVRCGIGDLQRLDCQLLLHLKRPKTNRRVVHVGVYKLPNSPLDAVHELPGH